MKKHLSKVLSLVCFCALIYGCSLNDKEFSINDLVIDDKICEIWDGNNIPSWLGERYMDFVINDTKWTVESYYVPMLCEINKLSYEDNTLLAISYDRFGFRGTDYYCESGTLCYTNDGKRIDFDGIKGYLDRNAVMLWTNRMDDNNIPKLSDFELDNTESLEWLQTRINDICNDIQEPEQLLYEMSCGYTSDGTETYIALEYKYFDKQNISDGEIKIQNIYTLDGTEITNGVNINKEELCTVRIMDILNFLQ